MNFNQEAAGAIEMMHRVKTAPTKRQCDVSAIVLCSIAIALQIVVAVCFYLYQQSFQ